MGMRLSLPWHHLWALMPQNSPFKSVGLFGNSVVAFWLLLPTGQPWPKGLCWDLEPLQSLGSCSWCLWPAKATLLPCPAAGSLGLQPGVNIARAQHLSTQPRTVLRGDPGPQTPGDHGHWGHSLGTGGSPRSGTAGLLLGPRAGEALLALCRALPRVHERTHGQIQASSQPPANTFILLKGSSCSCGTARE